MNTISTTAETCPLCGESLHQNANACDKCDWVRGYRQHQVDPLQFNTRDATAFALSFIPGAGQLFKGHLILGGAMLLIGMPVVVVFAFAFTMFFGWLLVPAYWFAVAVDAYLRKDLRAEARPGTPVHA